MTDDLDELIRELTVATDGFDSLPYKSGKAILDLRFKLETARNDALEEAAATCGKRACEIESDDDYSIGHIDGSRSAAVAIRALKSQQVKS